jgi:hypothetical protein
MKTIYCTISYHVAAVIQSAGLSEYEVVTDMLVDIAVFWVTKHGISVKINQSFGGTYCFHHQGVSRLVLINKQKLGQ